MIFFERKKGGVKKEVRIQNPVVSSKNAEDKL